MNLYTRHVLEDAERKYLYSIGFSRSYPHFSVNSNISTPIILYHYPSQFYNHLRKNRNDLFKIIISCSNIIDEVEMIVLLFQTKFEYYFSHDTAYRHAEISITFFRPDSSVLEKHNE